MKRTHPWGRTIRKALRGGGGGWGKKQKKIHARENAKKKIHAKKKVKKKIPVLMSIYNVLKSFL